MTKSRCRTVLAALLALSAAPAALAQDGLPRRKAGLWELSMEMSMRPGAPMKSQQCVDEKSDEAMQRRAMAGGDERTTCVQKQLKRTGTVLEIQTECTSPEGKTFIDSRASGDFNGSYSVDNRMRFEPPRHGIKDATMKLTGRHAGACPAGMKPGELRMMGMTLPAGGPPRPGAAPGAMPGGLDPSQIKGMSPEQLKQLAEQLKKAQGN